MKDKKCENCIKGQKLLEELGYTEENGYEETTFSCIVCKSGDYADDQQAEWMEKNNEQLENLPMVREAVIILAKKGISIKLHDSLFDVLQRLEDEDAEMFRTALKYPKGIPSELKQ